MFEGLMSLWTIHLSVPLCKYAKDSAIPTATLYLTDHGRDEQPFTPLFLPASKAIRNQTSSSKKQTLTENLKYTMQMPLQASTGNVFVD